jgi:hypothetical protein
LKKDKHDGKLQEMQKRKVCLALVDVLRYLAEMNICHEKNHAIREMLSESAVGGDGL